MAFYGYTPNYTAGNLYQPYQPTAAAGYQPPQPAQPQTTAVEAQTTETCYATREELTALASRVDALTHAKEAQTDE